MPMRWHGSCRSFGHLPQTEERIWRICAENLERYAAGDPLRNLVREIPL